MPRYLRSIYNTVLLKDVVARLGISDVTSLENVAKFLMHNIGSKGLSTKIANTMKSMGKGVDQETVDRYIGSNPTLCFCTKPGGSTSRGSQLATQSKLLLCCGYRSPEYDGSDRGERHRSHTRKHRVP